MCSILRNEDTIGYSHRGDSGADCGDVEMVMVVMSSDEF